MTHRNIISHKIAQQEGFVSLFTVIFFMLFISVITIGFLRIMAIEQQQALDNDLTASALAAAESGVEDGKRALLKYANPLPTDPPTLHGDLTTALSSTSCNALFTSPSISTALNLRNNGSITGVAGLNQYYTCLSVNINSPDYISSASAGKSDFIPLTPEIGKDFDQVKVSWHLTSNSTGTDGDGVPARYAPDFSLPQVTGGVPANSWTAQGYPAYLRVEVYGYANGSFDRTKIDDRTRTIFLVPNASTNAAAVDEFTPVNLGLADPRGLDQPKTGVQGVKCNGTPPSVPIGTYACAATLELPTDPTLRGSNNHYFVRITPLYGSTHFKLALEQAGVAVNFGGVQPIIDVTGRAGDVFRRVQARVRLDSIGDVPEYTVESADTICKNMQVADGVFYQPNNCP